jgi:hypothetical protein
MVDSRLEEVLRKMGKLDQLERLTGKAKIEKISDNVSFEDGHIGIKSNGKWGIFVNGKWENEDFDSEDDVRKYLESKI